MREHGNKTTRKQRLFFAAAMVRQNKGRSPNQTMYAQRAGGANPGPRGPPNNWLRTLKDHLAVLRSTEGYTEDSTRQFGVETALWVQAAQEAGKRYRGILEAAGRFMARWHVEE